MEAHNHCRTRRSMWLLASAALCSYVLIVLVRQYCVASRTWQQPLLSMRSSANMGVDQGGVVVLPAAVKLRSSGADCTQHLQLTGGTSASLLATRTAATSLEASLRHTSVLCHNVADNSISSSSSNSQIGMRPGSGCTQSSSSSSSSSSNSVVRGVVPAAVPPKDTGYRNMSQHPVCLFLTSGHRQDPSYSDEIKWAGSHICDIDKHAAWLRSVQTNCYSCMDGNNVCQKPQQVIYHQFIEKLSGDGEANLWGLRSFLMTQNLHQARTIVWTSQRDLVVTNNTAGFFHAFVPYVQVRHFNYTQEIKGTVWEADLFLGNYSLVRQHMPDAGAYTDLVRILLLHKYGGLWYDNDVVFYQDVSHLVSTTYQFVMRWMNLHVMYLKAGSPVSVRLMNLATSIPLNHPNFTSHVLEEVCNPVGYFSNNPSRFGNTDIYNSCLFRLIMRKYNTGPAEDLLYDMPMPLWAGNWPDDCGRAPSVTMNDTFWRETVSLMLAMHYSGHRHDGGIGPESSSLHRSVTLIRSFFHLCDHIECLPLDGMSLAAYEALAGYDVREQSSDTRAE